MYARRRMCGACTTVHGVGGVVVLAGSDEARLVGEYDELGAVTGTKLHHRTAYVRLGGRWTDDEPFGDFIVGQTTRHQRHHFTLSLGQRRHVS